MIEIQVNGRATQVADGETILGLLGSLGIKPDRVAVELDRNIIRQPEWAGTILRGGAQVEIVHFVGGG